MGNTENVEKAPKTSWFTGIKAEFRKIIWPDQKSYYRVAGLVNSVWREFPCWFKVLTEAK